MWYEDQEKPISPSRAYLRPGMLALLIFSTMIIADMIFGLLFLSNDFLLGKSIRHPNKLSKRDPDHQPDIDPLVSFEFKVRIVSGFFAEVAP